MPNDTTTRRDGTMADDHPHSGPYAGINADHAEIRQGIESLLGELAGDGNSVYSLRGAISSLTSRLREHFQEEEGGLYSDLLNEHPRLANKLERLLAEHGEIIEQLNQAVALMDREAPAAEIRERLQRTFHAILQHESYETGLIMKTEWEDIGGSG